MKTLLIATAATLALSGTAFAQQYDGSVSPAQFAAEHFAKSHETGDGPRQVRKLTDEDRVTLSTKGSSLAEFAAAKLYNGQDDER